MDSGLSFILVAAAQQGGLGCAMHQSALMAPHSSTVRPHRAHGRRWEVAPSQREATRRRARGQPLQAVLLPDAMPLAAWASCKEVRELVSKVPTKAARLPVIALRGAWGRGEALARMEPVVLAVICLDAIICAC